MGINKLILKLWVDNEISKIDFKIKLGTIDPKSGQAQTQVLVKLFEDFNLSEVNEEEYVIHNQI
jgi:hypothetical protein